MPRIKADQLQEGMVVARDVKNIDGMLLVSSGAVLSARQVTILQTWGIFDVEVEGPEDGSQSGDTLSRLSPEALAKLTGDLKARFWNLNEMTSVETEIFNLMLVRGARGHSLT